MQTILHPAVEWELRSLIAEAASKATALEVEGAGTKRGIGRPGSAATVLSTTAMRGVTLYEPAELIMSARTGTLLSDIEAELASRSQMLAFEPIDLGPALGLPARKGTIGGVFATNFSGARRISGGAARDHLLGVRAVTGRAELFKSGGRVLKNVTGYDLARGLCGSWGTLAVMSEVTFKVLPRAERTMTLILFDLPDQIAAEAMCAALGTPYEVSGAAHFQAGMAKGLPNTGLRDQGRAVTALRIENFAPFAEYRTARLKDMLAPYGDIHVLDDADALTFWSEFRQLSFLQHDLTASVWRISTVPRSGPKVVDGIARYMPVAAVYDWAGGLAWIEVPASADAGATDIRRVIAVHGGHATLIRASPEVMTAVDVFHPLEPGVGRISAKLKAAFDPAGILSPGRMAA